MMEPINNGSETIPFLPLGIVTGTTEVEMSKGDFVRFYKMMTGHYPDKRKVKSHITVYSSSNTTEFDVRLLVFDSAKKMRHFKKYSRMMERKSRCR